MPRSPRQNQDIRDARRCTLLAAAARVFAKKGFDAAKIADIAKEAGLSHGLVYHYFADKDAVFAAILEQKLDRLRATMTADDAIGGTALERIRMSLERWAVRSAEDPDMGRMIAQALLSDSLSPQVRNLLHTRMRALFANTVERIREGQGSGEIGAHATPEQLAAALTCLMRGVALTRLAHPGWTFELPSAETILRILAPGPMSPTQASVGAGVTRRRPKTAASTEAGAPPPPKPGTRRSSTRKREVVT